MITASFVAILLTASAFQPLEQRPLLEPTRRVMVDQVWSGASAPFCLVTRGSNQYVAYYAADRKMTIACRNLDSEKWTYQKLDSTAGWDSHNYITFAFDSKGYIHLSGNMHCCPLLYYRSTKPEDITTLERVKSMVGDREQRATYPKFSTGPDGQLLFSYRDGASGDGSEIVNAYDVSTRTWKRYVDTQLFDGQGKMNAYYSGPIRDSKGVYHIAWVWRDTPDCSTNHDLSYARSTSYRDGFSKSDGTPVQLPLTIANTEIVDPIPVESGLLNATSISLDSRDRPMITYHKYDAEGLTQAYIARREPSGWRIYNTTDWKDRWEFNGGGSIANKITLTGPVPWESGKLCQIFVNKFQGPYWRVRFLDEATLQPVGQPQRLLPEEFETPTAKHTPDWQVNTRGLSMPAIKTTGSCWVLRWESAGPNRDRPRDTVPPATKLEVVELRARK